MERGEDEREEGQKTEGEDFLKRGWGGVEMMSSEEQCEEDEEAVQKKVRERQRGEEQR
jgi:head-tail adaptor